MKFCRLLLELAKMSLEPAALVVPGYFNSLMLNGYFASDLKSIKSSLIFRESGLGLKLFSEAVL